ncbi:hypothetical protein H9655_12185 [Cytobacillus sp. Sa5YUA1]|uniref:Uncharacterized protein n=1 Tax=Cytobacillus stercorigallinarum TaxID=2762240 RepID=A0ABR8QQG3_9BACI|nr:hypothetical protein [Cytobacillus stercorigallinarum]MBD7937781.1 hypothetical protein [Cytobacillus stercorigallinarum]
MAEELIKSMVAHNFGVSILLELLLETIPKNCVVMPLKEESYRILELAIKFNCHQLSKDV